MPDHGRHPLRRPDRNPVEVSAARLRPVGNRLRILRRLAEGRGLRPAQRSPAATGTGSRRSRRRAERLRPGRPEHQDLSKRALGRPGASARARRSQAANGTSASTRSASSWPCWSPPPASPTTPAASICSRTSPQAAPASPKPGPTPATAPRSSSTAPACASTSKSPAAALLRRLQGHPATLGRRADVRLAHAPPPPRPRLRDPPPPLRSHDQGGHGRPREPTARPRIDPELARHMTTGRRVITSSPPSAATR